MKQKETYRTDQARVSGRNISSKQLNYLGYSRESPAKVGEEAEEARKIWILENPNHVITLP